MATMITSECINCGACESECPNTAIYQGGVEWVMDGVQHPALALDIFYIVPEKCTECVGFHDQEACAVVCPVDCCIPNPDIPETEAQLLIRAKQLHPEKEFGPEFPSRFRKPGAAAGEATASAGAPTAAPATAPRPVPAATAETARPSPTAAPATPPVAPPPAVPDAAPVPTPVAARAEAAPAAAEAETLLSCPARGEWEVPIDCFRCGRTYAAPSRHIRSGVVLYCPFCRGSYVVTTSMFARISGALTDFDRRWRGAFQAFEERRRRELEEFEERQRRALEEFNRTLKRLSAETRPPGAPRKRAWIFG